MLLYESYGSLGDALNQGGCVLEFHGQLRGVIHLHTKLKVKVIEAHFHELDLL